MSLLEIRGLTVRYGLVTAVDDVSLSVERGEVLVVLGANGAGKSSMLGAVAGALRPAAGEIVFDGTEIGGWRAEKTVRRGLVLVPEGRRVIAPLSVGDNLRLGAYSLGSRRREREILAEVHELFPVLAERADVPGGLLSGGEQQMLAFGRAMMADPRMMLLDEPSMGLAPVVVDVIMDSILAIAARGISIMMVEQNAGAAFDVASKAAVLDRGKVVKQGPAKEIATDPTVLQAFLGIEA
jgi:branched-chain amino acid transport system ATP-binding protein